MSETNKDRDIHTHALIGERLCLDFANTVSWHDSEDSREWLTSYEQLVGWCLHADILTEQQALSLLQQAEGNPAEATKILEKALEFREAIYRIFSSISNDETPGKTDLSILNGVLVDVYRSIQIIPGEDKFSLQFRKPDDSLAGMLSPIVQSAIDILVSEKDLKRVKKCEGDPCGWLFLDTSRNRSRRWCSMADCGNRAKARRFYQNKK
ncbi:ABATE domain-containing protein [Alkalihalobacillus sp. AL-G]|uniref:CGNR zinc finger domain-containing protein n=1 Tax=Alkalihalobacillus sp. AL-G TaxID=2926399 RepID=UPI00272B080E|nr:ABATE domain-containing protein [Alkalihalobacillus sp. AL-G]WLD93773.1 CGNR zinc finger domain-containing protein [Alkalihalobacillus sp. AL-G]